MPTGPNCEMTWDECVAFARRNDIANPEAYCASRERD